MDTTHSTNKTKAITLLATATLIFASLLTMGFGLPLQPAWLAGVVTITVTSTDDVVADDGVCTLREAIIAANTNTPSGGTNGECPAGQEAKKDTITLAAGETYTLTIAGASEDDAAAGDLDIWDNVAAMDLTIGVEGDGKATIQQDASGGDRVLDILGATVKIEGLILTGGSNVGSGGGVQNTR